MTKEESKKAREVMEAWENGAEIEVKFKELSRGTDSWDIQTCGPQWNWKDFDFRIAKPKPVELAVGMELVLKDNMFQPDLREVRSLYSNECCYTHKGRLAIDTVGYILSKYHGLVGMIRHELFVEEPF